MSEMVERVARAIWDKRRESAAELGINLEEWGDGGIPRANKVFEEARAAIEAMRKPTQEMINAADNQDDQGSSIYGEPFIAISHEDAWQVMIDEALK